MAEGLLETTLQTRVTMFFQAHRSPVTYQSKRKRAGKIIKSQLMFGGSEKQKNDSYVLLTLVQVSQTHTFKFRIFITFPIKATRLLAVRIPLGLPKILRRTLGPVDSGLFAKFCVFRSKRETVMASQKILQTEVGKVWRECGFFYVIWPILLCRTQSRTR